MNILFVGVRKVGEDIMSGPLKISNYLYNKLVEEHDNLYYYGFFEEEVPENPSEISVINDREVRGPVKKIGEYIKKNNIEVVYFARYNSKIALYLIALKKLLGFKLVYTVHGLIKKESEINKSFKFYHGFIESFLLKNCDKIVVISHALREELQNYYPNLNEEKIIIINNAVSLTPIKDYINIRELYGLDNSKKIIFSVGVRKIKNIELLLREFVSNYELYNKTYLIVAGETDTEYAVGVINQYGQYDNIKFIGMVDTNHMNNIYSQCDLFVQISEFETFGMAIVEALLHKKKVLISSHLPISQYFKEGEVCFYDQSEDDLGRLLHKVIDVEKNNEEGFRKANELFQWSKVAEEYYNVFTSV